MILDGAEVIAISKKANFGVIKYTDDSIDAIPIKYLAVCKYETDETIYLFMCNENEEVEQDTTYDSVENAKKRAKEINQNVIWEDGIRHISFDNVDFKGGKVNYIEVFGEDMIEIKYPNGYMIDVGYYESEQAFGITIVKNDDWINIIKEVEAKTDIELKTKLISAIDWVKEQER